jgi:hypothetical protein
VASLAPAPGPNANIRVFAPPRAGRSKLRVGVFADSAQQPRWLVEALAKVAASDFAELTLVATATGDRGQTTCSGSRKGVLPNGTGGLSPVLWRAYCHVDRLLFGQGPDWSEKRDLDLLVSRTRRMELDEGDAATWRARIQDFGLDVAFALGEVDDAALEGLARCGVWRYCFGEEQDVVEPLAGVREVIGGAPVLASGIRIHRGAGLPDRLAYQSWSRTFPFSFTRSREGVLPKTAEFIARTLRDLHSSGPGWLEQSTTPARDVPEQGFPGSVSLIRDLSRVGWRVARRTAEKYTTVGQWMLAFRFDGEPELGPGPGLEPPGGTLRRDDGLENLDGYVRLQPPKDRFWADPFPISRNGRHWIFFEELPFAAGRAHISAIEVHADGSSSEPVRVLERDYHLSYPFLIEDEGQLYMIPETAHNHTVEIYRCVDFPRKWKLERVLMKDVWCADATIHRAHDRLWMFASVGVDGGEVNDELHLFSSDRLLGDWKPHRRNPVKSDVRSARPAGRLFTQGGELYRPAQICTPIYGSGIAINRVTALNDYEYAEEEVSRILPAANAGLLGIHTINRAGGLSVTDAFVRRSRFRA